MRVLMWFRADLRVGDNTALHHACKEAGGERGDGVVAVFTICPRQWRDEHDWSDVKVDFILRNLEALKAELESLNIPLRIVECDFFDGVPNRLLKLARETKCEAIYFNRELEWNEARRDEAVRETFESKGLTVKSFRDQTMWEPGKVRTKNDDYYSVFSPFKRKCYTLWKHGDRPATHPKPKRQAKIDGAGSDKVPSRVKKFDTKSREKWAELHPAGEKSASARLAAFMRSRVDDYDESRDLPAQQGTSGMSPYLTMGVISIRRCMESGLNANDDKVDSGAKGPVGWMQELIWREFYKHILVGFPRVSRHEPFQRDTDQLDWNEPGDKFEKWCEGRTGVPIVDAGMRQLNEIGWMHNRLRMITAMYLTKDLFINWRLGEKYFMERLVDGDLASNNGGWQWSASTGTDAQPYFRVMNPFTQSKRYDPDGEYIRRWVPELEELEGKAIHEPHTLKEKGSSLFGKLDYPEPLVDHKQARQHAIETFRKLKKG